jgi:hypothetical protein
LTPFRDALQVFSASLRKPARRYGYRGLKIVTSLALRFQDFQRKQFKFFINSSHVFTPPGVVVGEIFKE